MTARKKTHEPGWNHVPPTPGEAGYIRVVNRGCGGHYWESYNGREFDCSHDYTWSCDECPIVQEKYITGELPVPPNEPEYINFT